LIALQHRKASKAEIAIMTKLDLLKTNEALHTLKELGLAKQDRTTAWHVTRAGKSVFSRPFRIDSTATVVSPAPAHGACSKSWSDRCAGAILRRNWGLRIKEFTSLRSGCMHKGV